MELFLKYDWPGNLKELELLLDEIASMITNEKLRYILKCCHYISVLKFNNKMKK